MKRSSKYVDLDVHQATTVTAVQDEGGRVVARTVLPAAADAIVEYFRGTRGTIHVALEEARKRRAARSARAIVHRVVICDRRRKSQHGNRGD